MEKITLSLHNASLKRQIKAYAQKKDWPFPALLKTTCRI